MEKKKIWEDIKLDFIELDSNDIICASGDGYGNLLQGNEYNG